MITVNCSFTILFLQFVRIHHGGKDGERHRGLGTDVAIVSSMVFPGQFLLSLLLGGLMHATGTTLVIPCFSAILSFFGAMSALFVEYAESNA